MEDYVRKVMTPTDEFCQSVALSPVAKHAEGLSKWGRRDKLF